MKLSMKSDYALRALFSLIEHHGQGPITISELSRRNDVPKSFLEHIMVDLKQQGWVKSTSGRHGGYALARDPAELTLGQIIRHFDGILAPIGCVSVFACRHCNQESSCKFRNVLLEIRNVTASLADRATLAAVYAGQTSLHPTEQLVNGAGI